MYVEQALAKCRRARHQALAENGLLDDKPGPATGLEIKVKAPEVVHEVTVLQIKPWLAGASTSPNEMVRKKKLQAMLG